MIDVDKMSVCIMPKVCCFSSNCPLNITFASLYNILMMQLPTEHLSFQGFKKVSTLWESCCLATVGFLGLVSGHYTSLDMIFQ